MSVSRLIASSLVVVLAACTAERVPGPAADLRHAAATRTCGPADGPAVAIYLAPAAVASLEPPAPYVRIAVWQPPERLAGRTWALDSRNPDGGAAWFHASASEFEIATGGRLTVTAVRPDGTIEGSADVIFPRAGRVRARFRAAWLPQTVLCG